MDIDMNQKLEQALEENKRLLSIIEEYQKNEERFKESEQRYKVIAEYSGFGIVLCSSDFYFISANQAFCKITGYSTEELAKTDFKTITHPDDLNAEFILLNKLIHNEINHYDYIKRYITKQNEIIWVELNVSCYRNQENKIEYFIGIVHDIDNKIRTEKLSKITHEKYKVLFENLPIGITITDKLGNIIEANQASERMLSVSKDEHQNRTIDSETWKIIRIDGTVMPSEEFASTRALQENRLIQNVEMGIHKNNDEITWINVTAAPINLENFGVVIAYNDITEKILAEKKLIESEEKFRLLFENLPVGFCLCEIIRIENAKITDFKFLDVNDELCKQTGYQKDAILNKYFSKLLPEIFDRLIHIITEVIETKKTAQVEYQIPDSKKVYKISIYSPQKNRFAIISADITDRKAMESELIQAKELAEVSDRLKTAFLHNMSHEFRTPMNAIIGFSGFLENPNLNHDKRINFIKKIQENAKNLLEIINEVIDVSKIASGQLQIEEQIVSLNHLIENIKNSFTLKKDKINKNHIDFVVNNKIHEQYIQFITDFERLSQILTNLIENAFKFTDNGFVELGCLFYNPETLLFYVKDSGIGIAQQQQNIIFERFRQVEESTTRRFGGTGLGLAIVKGLVDTLNGKVWLESEINKGSTFFFTIPFKTIEKQ